MKKKSNVILLLVAVIIAAVIIGIMIYPVVSERMAEDTSTETQSTNNSDNASADTTDSALEDTDEKASEDTFEKAPDFTVLDKDGNEVTLSGIVSEKNKPIIINFWATWCPPCVRELPHFEAMYKEYGDEIEFLMVNLTDGYDETIEKVNTFTSDNAYTFPVYFDTKAGASVAYSIRSIPLTVLVDANGNIVTSQVGAMDEKTLKGYIDLLIGE